MHLTLLHLRFEQTLHQRMQEYNNLFVNSNHMSAKTKPNDLLWVLQRHEREGHGNAALMFEDAALRFGYKGPTKISNMSLDPGVGPRIEYSEAYDQNSLSTHRRV